MVETDSDIPEHTPQHISPNTESGPLTQHGPHRRPPARDFAEACATRTLEAEDRARLYELMLHIHRRNLKTGHRTIRDDLIHHGWPLRKATWLSMEYHHFAELLAWYDGQSHTDVT
jgi:hypothetical protein